MVSKSSPGIIRSTFRSFCSALGFMLGLCFGFLLLVAIAASAGNGLSSNIGVFGEHLIPQLMPDADGTIESYNEGMPVILRVDIEGTIGLESLTTEKVYAQLVRAQEDLAEEGVLKAVLIYLQTPGGTVTDSNGIYEAITAFKQHTNVPVYGFVDGICASGGMYIGAACDQLYANEISAIGSIGVITGPFFNVHETLSTLGVESLLISYGTGKDSLSPFHAWKDNEGQDVQALTASLYDHFVDLMVEARPKLDRNTLVNEIGASILPARRAYELGLIDGFLDSSEAALAQLATDLGLNDQEYQVVRYGGSRLFSFLMDAKSPASTGKMEHYLRLPGDIDPRLQGQQLYLWSPGHS